MIFIADHHYKITYKAAASVTFKAIDNNAAFHLKRVSIGDEQSFLYKLVTEDLDTLEEIYMPIAGSSFDYGQKMDQLSTRIISCL